jgi:DNA-binding NarL/FixJ family response regulator
LNGFDAVRQLKKEGTQAKIIFLTMHADQSLAAEALRCGGSGYVLKQSAGEELISVIGQVLAGHEYVTPLVATESARAQNKVSEQTQTLRLTPRQREVLQLIIEGCTMREIASRLGISTRTAESHKYEMMQSLGVESTAELIQYALKLGLTST